MVLVSYKIRVIKTIKIFFYFYARNDIIFKLKYIFGKKKEDINSHQETKKTSVINVKIN